MCSSGTKLHFTSFSLHLLCSGLNSILFAINIDNSDLNGAVTRGGSSVSHLLKESTQGIGSLWKESTQGVSSLLREIGTATAVVPGFTPKVDGASDPLPVVPRSTSAGRATAVFDLLLYARNWWFFFFSFALDWSKRFLFICFVLVLQYMCFYKCHKTSKKQHMAQFVLP